MRSPRKYVQVYEAEALAAVENLAVPPQAPANDVLVHLPAYDIAVS